MAIQTTNSWSHSFSLDLGTSEIIEGYWETENTSLDVVLAVQSSPEETQSADDDAVLAILTETIAVGDDTLALCDIDAMVASGNNGSIVTADVALLSAATAGDGATAYTNADASLSADFSDFMFLYSMDLMQTTSNPHLATSLSAVEMNLLTVNGTGGSLPFEPSLADASIMANESLDLDGIVASGTSLGHHSSLPHSSTDFILHGELAIAEITAHAIGFDSLIDIYADAFSIENHFSMVVTEVLIAAD